MQTIWITGASSGIGEACAYEYAKGKNQLILTSSSRERLEPVAAQCLAQGAKDVCVLPADFNDLEGITLLVRTAWDAFGGIDVLFCNAGISQRTNVEDTSMDMVRQIMEINYFAPVALTKAVLPLMLQAGGGHIAVTTSIAGVFGFPLRCAYSSSKHALYGFFETLQAEYYDRNIRVTIVCPGRVRTNISMNALDKGGEKHGTMDPGQDKGLPADKAAKQIVRAIRKGQREVLIGRGELIMVYIKRFFPALCAKLARRIKPM
ncbi:MAG: SDR family oxidoreductase [Paludibacteraceae bacterium]|nr:SDR family oxidoreductase [Paludibacteraceae bacterium]